MKPRVVWADAETLFRVGWRHALPIVLGGELIGEAGDGPTAISLVLEKKPDVFIVDAVLPGLSGIEVTRRVIEAWRGARIVICSSLGSGPVVQAAFTAGARGFLLKTCDSEELQLCFRAILEDRWYVTPTVAEAVLLPQSKESQSVWTRLSAREREVLQMFVEGKTTREIARILHRSPKTVETHRYRIMLKLGRHSFADLVRVAIVQGLVRL